MPKRNDEEKIELQRKVESQQLLIADQSSIINDLRKQIEELVKQIAALQKNLHDALQGNKEQTQDLKELREKLDELLFQIRNQNREEYGPRTEHHNPKQGPPPESSESDDEDTLDTSPGSVGARLKKKATKEQRPRNHKKHINDQDLPEKEVKHSVKPEERVCPHCHCETTLVSYVETSQLERVINSLIRLKHKQEVRSCQKCKDYIVTAEKPCPPIPGSYGGPSLISSIIIDKFADGLPNYRQAKRFRRQNTIIARSTQCDWVIAASLTIEPLYELLKREVLSSKVVQTDDSWAKVQDRSLKSHMRKAKMTSYMGDKHHPFNFFDYSPTLSFDKNKETLKDFKGYVQADAANGFDALFEKNSGRIEVGCSAHSRRKYWLCAQDDAYEMICGEILEIYRGLYKIEKEIRNQDSETRLVARQSKSKPLTDQLKEKILDLQDSLPPTNPLMKAVNYTLNHWDALVRFLDDPDFEIDNNACERSIKSWVLVRKNALFLGSDAGGKAAAIHLSFISSCDRLGIDPLEYLTDVYSRINSMKTSELEQLLPDRWARSRAIKPPP